MALPQDIIDNILQDILPSNDVWSDYHCDLRLWQAYYDTFVMTGQIPIEQFPPKPVYTDYTNLTMPRTRCDTPKKPVYVAVRVDSSAPSGTLSMSIDGGLRFDSDPITPGWQEDSAWIGGYYGPKREMDPAKAAAMFRDYAAGALFVHNVEHLPWDIRVDDPAEVEQTVLLFINLVSLSRQARPDMQFGFYMLPLRDYWNVVDNNVLGWQNANDALQPVIDTLDVVNPSLYTFYDWSQPTTQANNRLYIEGNIQEARRVANDKPVIPFIWASYHDSNQTRGGTAIDINQWQEEVRLILSLSDGVILWGYNHQADHTEHLSVLLEEANR